MVSFEAMAESSEEAVATGQRVGEWKSAGEKTGREARVRDEGASSEKRREHRRTSQAVKGKNAETAVASGHVWRMGFWARLAHALPDFWGVGYPGTWRMRSPAPQ